MSESILKALMRLFAIIAETENEDGVSSGKTVVEGYLKQFLNQEQVEEYLNLFVEYVAKHHSKKGKKRLSANSVKVLAICEQVNEELRQEQKILVLLQLFEFINFSGEASEYELEFVKTVADTFNVSPYEYENCRALILDKPENIPGRASVLIINNEKEIADKEVKHIYNENLSGQIVVLYIESTKMFAFGYIGEENIYLNGHIISPKRVYVMVKGSAIRGPRINTIYYSDVVGKFLSATAGSRIVFTAKDVEFKFKNSDNGLHHFNFSEETGKMIGVMGGSGAGKSTLLNIFNGNIRPQKGEILINGYNLHTDKEKIKGVIGFIPQDDLLIEELTVFQNLYYNAKLCFAKFTEKQMVDAVNKVLLDLDLYEIRNLKVGSPLNKFISGGQRKRLNIALELIREPAILFVDEPTSGLSSMDSEMVMDLLKEITLKGKLAIINIHQPSSDIYKMFDKLLILDKGGHPIYIGNPVDAVVYFKQMTNHVNATEGECLKCGNVNPEQVLQIVESKVVDEYGKLTRIRKVAPKEWYKLYKENVEQGFKEKEYNREIPENNFSIPSLLKQFRIFVVRDVLSKLTNRQYILLNFLEAPLLAVILGYFTKYIAGENYIFSENENLVAYIFMAVVVALFLGMTVSAEEIIRDRKILQRERFLNLSKFSYINSKTIIMFTLSAVQTFSFVLVGNYILGIQGMTFNYWIVLFSASCFANMLGLNISSALNSVVTIYILIPFILVPQLLLSGVIVKFEKLHKSLASQLYVPVVGDMMTSRWAYEAIAVTQFKDNEYEKYFFKVDKELAEAKFTGTTLITELATRNDACETNIRNKTEREKTIKDLVIIRNEINRLMKAYPTKPSFQYLDSLDIQHFTPTVAEGTRIYLESRKKKFNQKYNDLSKKKDQLINKLIATYKTTDEIYKFRENYYNISLADLVTNKNSFDQFCATDDRLIQVVDPVFKEPESGYGRAHFYSPVKIIFGKRIDTLWFNVMVIWLTTLVMYISLCFDGLKKLLDIGDKLNVKKLFRKKGKE